MQKPATKHKTDIFEVLGNLNKKNEDYYANLPEDQQKSLQPLLLQRWMSGTLDARQVFLLNEVANPYVFSLYKHKDLLWKLLTVCAPGKFAKYQWMSQKGAGAVSRPITTAVVMEYYKYSTKHAKDAVQLLSVEQVIELAQHLGYQPEEIAKIKKEYNADGKRR